MQMNKKLKKTHKLAKMLLASSVFLLPAANAALVVTGINIGNGALPLTCTGGLYPNPQATSTFGPITIQSNGALLFPGCTVDAVNLDTTDPLVIDNFFFGGQAIAINADLGDAVRVTGGGSPTSITIGTGRTIVGDFGIFVNTGSDFNVLSNSGTISGAPNAGIRVIGSSPNGVITNNASGTITSANTNAINITSGAVVKEIINAGVMSINDAVEATINSTSSNGITNGLTNSGTIKNTGGGPALALNSGTLGFLINSGTITGDVFLGTAPLPTDPVLTMNGGTITGNVTAEPGSGSAVFELNSGTITGVVTLGLVNDTVDYVGGTFGSLDGNTGTDLLNIKTAGTANPVGNIKSVEQIVVDTGATLSHTGTIVDLNILTLNGVMEVKNSVNTPATTPTTVVLNNTLDINAGGSFNSIFLDATSAGGKIINTGTIDSTIFSAIKLGGTIDSITNSATIKNSTLANQTILSPGNVTVTNGIVNTGTLQNTGGGGAVVIDLSAANTTAQLFQNGGSILGNIKLASSGGNVFDMNGGTITGDITLFSTKTNEVDLAGGVITGSVFIGNQGDTINISAGSYQDIFDNGVDTGGATFNISGGTFVSINLNSKQNGDVVNITGVGPVTVTGNIIDVPNVNVKAPFILNGTITDVENFVGDDTVTVNGTIDGVPGTTVITINKALTVSATGTIKDSKQLILNAASTNSGIILDVPTINVNSPFISDGDIESSTDLTVNVDSTMTNSGTMKSSTGVVLDGASAIGVMINKGIMTTTGASPAVTIASTILLNKFENYGDIQNVGANPAILAQSGSDITAGIFNYGTITSAASSLDLSASFISLTQEAGTINTSDILLAKGGGFVFEINGGTVNSDVRFFSTDSSVGDFNGGAITGDVFLGNTGDTLNIAGGTYQNFLDNGADTGGATFNISGGTFVSINLNGNQNGDTINITGAGPVQPNGSITDVPNIDVVAPFISNGAITNVENLFVSSTMTLNSSVTGIPGVTAILVNGTLDIAATGLIQDSKSLTINGTGSSAGTITNVSDVTFNGPFNLLGTSIVSTIDNLTFNTDSVTAGTIDDINTFKVTGTGNQVDANSVITNVNTLLQIDAGSTLVMNNTLSGTAALTNNGVLTITNNGFIDLAGAYTGTGRLNLSDRVQAVPEVANNFNMKVGSYHQESGAAQGALSVVICSPTQFSSIQVDGGLIEFDANTIIYPTYTPVDFIAEGTVFPILVGGSNIIDNGVVVAEETGNSVVVSFQKATSNGNTEFDLVFHRLPYSTIVLDNPIAESIAPVITQIANAGGFGDPQFINLILQLDQLTTVEALTNALVALSPDVSYGMIEGAHVGMDRTFGTIWQRINEITPYFQRGLPAPNSFPAGINSGDYDDYDDCTCPYGVWIAPYGETLKQDSRQWNPGYAANAVGMAIGYDHQNYAGTVWGIAGSFTHVRVKGQAPVENVENVRSLQATAYSMWHPYEAVYINAMFGIATNKFQNNRYIDIGNIHLVPSSSRRGWQYGGQVDMGYVDCADTSENFYIVPVARLKGTYLQVQDFEERNAGSLNLSTQENNTSQFMVGAGVRLVKEKLGYPYSYLQELSVLYLYDMVGDAQQTVANFVGGGAAFPTRGVRPPRNVCLIDVSLDAYSVQRKDLVLTARYELELRDRFIANSGYLQLYRRWL